MTDATKERLRLLAERLKIGAVDCDALDDWIADPKTRDRIDHLQVLAAAAIVTVIAILVGAEALVSCLTRTPA